MQNRYLLYDHYGILNGKFFIQDYDPKNWNISESDIRILELGPENPAYLSTWKKIVNKHSFKFDNTVCTLEEDSNYNLFLIEVKNDR